MKNHAVFQRLVDDAMEAVSMVKFQNFLNRQPWYRPATQQPWYLRIFFWRK